MTEPTPDWILNTPSTPAIHTQPAKAGGEFTTPFTPASLFQIGEKLLEGFLARVVQALVGVFIPGGSGAAFTQLQAWATKILGIVPATIKLFTDILTFNWLAIPADLLSLAGLGVDAAPLSSALSQSVTSAPAVTLDASSFGSVNTGNPTSYTKPHRTGPAANMGMTVHVAIGPLAPKAYAPGFVTVTYNDVALERKGGIDSGHGTNGWLELFTLTGAASGLHDVVVTTAQPVHSIAASINTYAGVGSFSGFVSGATNAESQSLAVRGTPNGVVVVGMAAGNSISGASAGTQRTAENVDMVTNAGNLIVADAPGADSVTVTAGGSPAQVLIDLNAAVTAGGLSVNIPLAAAVTASGQTQAPFVTRDPSTGYLMFNGTRFRYVGGNSANDIGLVGAENIVLSGGVDPYGRTPHTTGGVSAYLTTHSQIDAYFASAVLMHANCFKGTWSAHTSNHVDAVQPTLGVFNAAALDPLDYALYKASQLGMKAVIPFAEQYTVKPWYVSVTGGGSADNFYTRTATVNAYKAHISYVLNHVNPYTGLAIKNDPTVLCFEIGNEFTLDGVTNAQYADWADDIGHHIKVVEGAQQLVQDGAYGVIPECLTKPYLDIFDQHVYDQYRTPSFLAAEAASAHAAGKAYLIGEFDWTDNPESSILIHTNWTLDQLLDFLERSPNIDGGTFWDLLAEFSTWEDGYSLKRPGTSADMTTRGDMLSDWFQRMSGITPKTFVSDTFTATDGVALSAHVGEAGATWISQSSYSGVSNIQSNRIYGGAAQGRYYTSGVPASADYTVSADIYVASNLGFAGVLARALSLANYSYAAYVWNFGGTVGVYLDYSPPGNIAYQAISTPAVGSVHNIALKVDHGSLSVYWDHALLIGPITNTGLPAAGRAGVIQGGGGSTSTGYHLDNFTAIDA